MEPSAVLHIDGGQLTAGDKAGGVAHAPPDLWKVEPKDYLTQRVIFQRKQKIERWKFLFL